MKNFIVDEQHIKWRLDKFLTEKLEKTRSQIKKEIEAGAVTINGKPTTVHQFLNFRDVVKIKNVGKLTKAELEPVVEKEFPEPTILEETKDYIILEKPPGLLVHATSKNEKNTLVNWLIAKYPEIKHVGDPVAMKKKEKMFRPGIVHRLDRDVSGVMLIARTQDAFDWFKSQFKLKTIKKEYQALVYGRLPQDQDVIEFEISRKKSGEKMAAHPKDSGKGKVATTEFDVIERFNKFTHVKINLLTGRTNQIRVHFFALGYPVVGDTVYKVNSIKKVDGVNRVFLHAAKIEFTDLNGEQKVFTSPLPKEMKSFINTLK